MRYNEINSGLLNRCPNELGIADFGDFRYWELRPVGIPGGHRCFASQLYLIFICLSFQNCERFSNFGPQVLYLLIIVCNIVLTMLKII